MLLLMSRVSPFFIINTFKVFSSSYDQVISNNHFMLFLLFPFLRCIIRTLTDANPCSSFQKAYDTILSEINTAYSSPSHIGASFDPEFGSCPCVS